MNVSCSYSEFKLNVFWVHFVVWSIRSFQTLIQTNNCYKLSFGLICQCHTNWSNIYFIRMVKDLIYWLAFLDFSENFGFFLCLDWIKFDGEFLRGYMVIIKILCWFQTAIIQLNAYGEKEHGYYQSIFVFNFSISVKNEA